MAFRWTFLGNVRDNIQWCGNVEKAVRKLSYISEALSRYQVRLWGVFYDDFAKVPQNLALPHILHVLMRRRAKHQG